MGFTRPFKMFMVSRAAPSASRGARLRRCASPPSRLAFPINLDITNDKNSEQPIMARVGQTESRTVALFAGLCVWFRFELTQLTCVCASQRTSLERIPTNQHYPP